MFFAVSFQLKLRDSLQMLRDLRSRYTARERVGDASGHPVLLFCFCFHQFTAVLHRALYLGVCSVVTFHFIKNYFQLSLALRGKYGLRKMSYNRWFIQDRQCTYNVTLRRVHETSVAVEKQ